MAEANAVALKLPPFYKYNPAMWFHQVEAQFTIRNPAITEDNTKFAYLLSALPADVAELMEFAVENATDGNKDTSDRPFNYWRRMVWWLTRTSASSERQLSISWATQSARTASPPLQTESTASYGYGSPLPPRRFRSSWEPSTSTTDLFPMHLRSYAPCMMFSKAVLGSSYGDASRTLLSRLPNKHSAMPRYLFTRMGRRLRQLHTTLQAPPWAPASIS